jgi:hypothetical protein
MTEYPTLPNPVPPQYGWVDAACKKAEERAVELYAQCRSDERLRHWLHAKHGLDVVIDDGGGFVLGGPERSPSPFEALAAAWFDACCKEAVSLLAQDFDVGYDHLAFVGCDEFRMVVTHCAPKKRD